MSLTLAQRGLYYGALADPRSTRFVVGERVEIAGVVQLDVLTAAIAQVTRQVPCVAGSDGNGGLRLEQPAAPLPVTTCECPSRAEAEALAGRLVAEPMPLDGPLLRHTVASVSETEHHWILVAHHVMCDGFSLHAIVQRCAAAYAALVAGAVPPPLPAWDTAQEVADEQRYLASSAAEADAAYWRRTVEGAAPTRCQGAWFPGEADAAPGAETMGHLSFCQPPSQLLTDAVRQRAAALDVSPAVCLATAVAVQLGRLNRQRSVLLAYPLMRRNTPARARLVAPLVNVVPLRLAADPSASVGELLSRNATALQEAALHADYPAEAMARDAHLDAAALPWRVTLGVIPLAQRVRFGDATGVVHTVRQGPLDDVAWTFHTGRQVATTVTAPRHVATNSALLQDLSGHLHRVLGRVATAPLGARAAELTREGRTLQTVGPSPSTLDPLACLEWQVKRDPDAPALSDGTTEYTRGELWRAIEARADQLRQPAAVLPVRAAWECATVVEMLACWRAGHAVAPYDPHWPERLIERVCERAAEARITARAVAWVIHTSGTTGAPKAVAVPMAAVATLLGHHGRTGYRWQRPFTMLMTSPLYVDAAFDAWCGVLFGHHVMLPPRELLGDPAGLLDFVARRGVDVIDATPALWARLLDEDDGQLAGVRRAHVGGDACSQALWTKMRETFGEKAINLYGPTETCVDATTATAASAEAPTVGVPVAGLRVSILDDALASVPGGAVGEVALEGAQLAAGYLGDPGLTARRFVAAPGGGRRYLTGDAGRFTASGQLVLEGRLTSEVKVRGYRVNLADVRYRLERLPGVSVAAVVLRGEHIVAFVQACAATDIAPQELLNSLAADLPSYALPTRLHVLPELPVDAVGNVVVAQLTEPREQATRRQPSDPAEQQVLAAFTDVLGDAALADAPTVEDFFGLGGDSITAIALIAALRERGWDCDIAAVFQGRTLAAIADRSRPAAHQEAVVDARDADDFGLHLDQETTNRVTALMASRRERSTP